MLTSQIFSNFNVHHLLICVLCSMYVVCNLYCFITVRLQRATVRACHMSCCPVLLSLYCTVIVFFERNKWRRRWRWVCGWVGVSVCLGVVYWRNNSSVVWYIVMKFLCQQDMPARYGQKLETVGKWLHSDDNLTSWLSTHCKQLQLIVADYFFIYIVSDVETEH